MLPREIESYEPTPEEQAHQIIAKRFSISKAAGIEVDEKEIKATTDRVRRMAKGGIRNPELLVLLGLRKVHLEEIFPPDQEAAETQLNIWNNMGGPLFDEQNLEFMDNKTRLMVTRQIDGVRASYYKREHPEGYFRDDQLYYIEAHQLCKYIVAEHTEKYD